MSEPDFEAILDQVATAYGGKAALARRLNVPPTTLSSWGKSGIAIKHVREVSDLTLLPLHQIRPDVYDGPDERAQFPHRYG